MFCWHKWAKVPPPLGWVVTEFDYRQCGKCGRYEAIGPPHWAVGDKWRKIEVPAPGYNPERERQFAAIQEEFDAGMAKIRANLEALDVRPRP